MLAPTGTEQASERERPPRRARPPARELPTSPPRSAAGTPHTPAAASSVAPRRRHAPGPARPPCCLSRAADARCRSTEPRRKPPLSLAPLKNYRASRSRGGRHTNSAGHLLLPGACGVVTLRRRSGRVPPPFPARARARARAVGRRRERAREASAFVEVGVSSLQVRRWCCACCLGCACEAALISVCCRF